MTGGKHLGLGDYIDSTPIIHVNEIDAVGHGSMKLSGLSEEESTIIVSAGSGTACIHAHKGIFTHCSGTGVGGGTVLGLSKLLLGTTDPEEIAALAEKGDESFVDLILEDGLWLAGPDPRQRDGTAAHARRPVSCPSAHRARRAPTGGTGCSLPAAECAGLMRSIQEGLRAKLRVWIPAMQICETAHSGGLSGDCTPPHARVHEHLLGQSWPSPRILHRRLSAQPAGQPAVALRSRCAHR